MIVVADSGPLHYLIKGLQAFFASGCSLADCTLPPTRAI